jgi:hypothetical protein
MQQELYLPRFSEEYPLLITPLGTSQVMRAIHCVIAMQVDIHRVRAGLSAATSLLGHATAPNDFEAICQQRTAIKSYLDVVNAAYNGSEIKGGSGFGLWHPHVATRALTKYGWAHVTRSYGDEWPNAPLANGAIVPIGVSATRVPICMYPYLFGESYPLSRDLEALSDPFHCVGAGAPGRAVSELQFGHSYGVGKPLFLSDGLTDDMPALGASDAWVGRNAIQFWPVNLASLRGTIFINDFRAQDLQPGAAAASRRTILAIPSENIIYGARNSLNI